MKISAEGFDYDKKWDIDGSRYNVLLKFRVTVQRLAGHEKTDGVD